MPLLIFAVSLIFSIFRAIELRCRLRDHYLRADAIFDFSLFDAAAGCRARCQDYFRHAGAVTIRAFI